MRAIHRRFSISLAATISIAAAMVVTPFAWAAGDFTNTHADVLALIAEEGLSAEVGSEGIRISGDDQAGYQFEQSAECAAVAEVAFVDGNGFPVQVSSAAAVAYLPSGEAQAVKVVDEADSFSMLVRSGVAQRLNVSFDLSVGALAKTASFTSRIHHRFSCDEATRFEIAIRPAVGFRGASDLPTRQESRLSSDSVLDFLDTRIEASAGPALWAKSGNSSLTCDTDGFDAVGPEWQLANVGDADQAAAVAAGGVLNLTADGTSLYHGTDNGGFFYQERAGGFRMEIDLVDIPVDAGGGFRKAGLMIRASDDPLAARVFIQYVPNNPLTGTSSLQFDYRGLNGVALELGSTPMGLSLPLRLAVDRRGDTFTVYYSTNGGTSWIRPAGAAGGSIDIAMPDTVQVGVMAASYDANTTMTASFDNFRLCEPNKIPLPEPPPGVGCVPGIPIDLIHVVDASGSMTAPFGPGETKLDAVRNAMVAMHDLLDQNLPGSRSALIAYSGRFNDRAYNLSSSVQVLAQLTSDLDSVDAAAQQIDQGMIHPDSTTPLPFALQATTDMLVNLGALNSLPVVVLWTDGFPNVDNQGWDALFYTNNEMRALTLYDGSGNFRPWGQVAWMGNYNPAIDTYDGEVFANTMVEVETLKNTVTDALIYGVAIQSDSIFKEDLLDYAAWYTSAEVLSVQDSITLVEGLGQIVDGLDCGGDIGDYVWDDANGDGVQDVGETGLAGVTVTLVDASNTVVATTVTDANGGYYFADVAAGTYSVVIDASTLPAGYQATYDLDGIGTLGVATVTLLDDQVIDIVDFGYQFVDTGDPWCPRTPGYWKNHLEVWPVSELTIGGVTYDEAGILDLLRYGGPDASTRLAKHLATTMLNLAMGSDDSIQSTVDEANAFLADHPPGSNPRGKLRGIANALKDVLDAYNNDPACH